MFGSFNAIQVAGAALMAVAGVVLGFPHVRAMLPALGGKGAGGKDGEGLTEADLRRANDICFELGAIARKSKDSTQREKILEGKQMIDSALTVDPYRTAKVSITGKLSITGDGDISAVHRAKSPFEVASPAPGTFEGGVSP